MRTKLSNYLANFAGGMDPMGIWTTQQAIDAERSGASPEEQRRRQNTAMAGGFVGGAALLPGTISGLVEGAQAVQRADPGKRWASFKGGFREGATAPYRALHQAHLSDRALSRTHNPLAWSRDERRAIAGTLRRVPIGAMLNQDPNARRSLNPLRAIHRGVRAGRNAGVAGLALGGAVGAVGASYQYRKGRQIEQDTQRRIMAKTSAAPVLEKTSSGHFLPAP